MKSMSHRSRNINFCACKFLSKNTILLSNDLSWQLTPARPRATHCLISGLSLSRSMWDLLNVPAILISGLIVVKSKNISWIRNEFCLCLLSFPFRLIKPRDLLLSEYYSHLCLGWEPHRAARGQARENKHSQPQTGPASDGQQTVSRMTGTG